MDVASRMNARKNYEDLAEIVSIYRTFTGAPGICDAQNTWMNGHA